MQWTADGKALYYVTWGQASNIWRQPLDGSSPVQVKNFGSKFVFNFAFSPDGKQLALARGTFNRDAVLIANP